MIKSCWNAQCCIVFDFYCKDSCVGTGVQVNWLTTRPSSSWQNTCIHSCKAEKFLKGCWTYSIITRKECPECAFLPVEQIFLFLYLSSFWEHFKMAFGRVVFSQSFSKMHVIYRKQWRRTYRTSRKRRFLTRCSRSRHPSFCSGWCLMELCTLAGQKVWTHC